MYLVQVFDSEGGIESSKNAHFSVLLTHLLRRQHSAAYAECVGHVYEEVAPVPLSQRHCWVKATRTNAKRHMQCLHAVLNAHAKPVDHRALLAPLLVALLRVWSSRASVEIVRGVPAPGNISDALPVAVT